MDEFFIETLKNILSEYKECADYIKDLNTPEYEEIKEDYSFVIDDITNLLKNVKTLDDLAEMDEDEIGYVYEYLDEYATNFVISNEIQQKLKDQKEYKQLDELLNLFLDDDEDFEDEE